MPAIITLTTDFGLVDPYVGAMKGAILSIINEVHLVDITHEIAPQDLVGVAFTLNATYRFYPKNTVHVAVVDPGVGTNRRAIAARAFDQYFVGPDNGVFSLIWAAAGDGIAAVEITNPALMRPTISPTFHGRDIFGPAAAHLARGIELTEFGAPLTDPVDLDFPRPDRRRAAIVGHIVHIDRFGNLITDIQASDLPNGPFAIVIQERIIPSLSQTFADVAIGEVAALFGSAGYLEIVVNGGAAARELNKRVGDTVIVRMRGQ